MGEIEPISRRVLLRDGAVAGAALASAGLLDDPTALARALPRRKGHRHPTLPSKHLIRRHMHQMLDLGPRLTGTKPHREFIDMLEHRFKRAGLKVHRDRHRFDRWKANGSSLTLLGGADAGPVPVSAYYTYSGRTPPAGVEGPLAYLGSLPPLSFSGDLSDPAGALAALEQFATELPGALGSLVNGITGGVAGKVAVIDAPIAPLVLAPFYALASYEHDPGNTLGPETPYKRAWTTILTLPALWSLRRQGAIGAVFVLDASAGNAAGQYTPFLKAYQDLPALIVSRERGERLRRAAAAGTRAKLRLPATLKPKTPSDSLVATLPGRKGAAKSVICHTHTDGQNAFEENAGIAQVALARYFARIPRHLRKRELVFSAVTGHFGPGLPETEGFIEDHPDIIERAAGALVIEHFGSREWVDDSRGYHRTGHVEPGVIFHTPGKMTKVGIASMKAADLRRSLLLKPINPGLPALPAFFGVGAAIHSAGVPTLAFIAGPNALLALQGRHGHREMWSAGRMHREIRWSADVLRRLVL